MSGLGQWLRSLVRGEGEGANVSASPDSAETSSVDAAVVDAAPAAVKPEIVAPDAGAPRANGCGAFRVGYVTDRGVSRDHNEDAVLVLTGQVVAAPSSPDFGLFIVSDGMGGHRKGEAASSLAVRTVASQLITQVYVSLLAGEDRQANQPALSDIVRDVVVQANHAVNQKLAGSGCTLTCAMVLGGRLFIGHVGDSRAYLWRAGGGLEQLTRDHSFVKRLIEVGQLTEEDAASHPRRNILYRAVGQPEDLEVDVVTRSLKRGERVLLCSDGLWNMVSQEVIGELTSLEDPQVACRALVDAANAAGGEDNISVVLVEPAVD